MAFFRRGKEKGEGVPRDVREALATVLHFIADPRLADDERMLAFVLTGADPLVVTTSRLPSPFTSPAATFPAVGDSPTEKAPVGVKPHSSR